MTEWSLTTDFSIGVSLFMQPPVALFGRPIVRHGDARILMQVNGLPILVYIDQGVVVPGVRVIRNPVSIALILPGSGQGGVMAYWCTLWVLQWWGFWRLPVTEASARVETVEHSRKVMRVKWLWSVGLLVVLVVPVPAFAVAWVLVLTFMSFVLLDETA
jgi:hypothetical protein